jgi:xanthine dehydrogenase accessory factor
VTDRTAWDLGLACGGRIRLVVSQLDINIWQAIGRSLASEERFVSAVITEGPPEAIGTRLVLEDAGVAASTVPADWQPEAIRLAEEILEVGGHRLQAIQAPGGRRAEFFVEAIDPPPTLVMVGGAHIASVLARLAEAAGFRTVLVDPRAAFATHERFPGVQRVQATWPEAAFAELALTPTTAVAVLTHDPKIDDPALLTALPSPAFYVGALGSSATHAERLRRLRTAGLDETALERLRGPIGLDLGGRSPAEIAVAILAEVVATQHNRRLEPRR